MSESCAVFVGVEHNAPAPHLREESKHVRHEHQQEKDRAHAQQGIPYVAQVESLEGEVQ